MSDKQVNCIIAFIFSGVLALVGWMSLWLFLILPVVVFFTDDSEEQQIKLASQKEMQDELDKAHGRIELLEDKNDRIRERLLRTEKKLQKLTKDPEADMKKIELDAEREITGGA
jgi:TolA-binding protein